MSETTTGPEVREFARLVETMRGAQRAYFDERSNRNLGSAKTLERRVDRRIAEILTAGPSLFDGQAPSEHRARNLIAPFASATESLWSLRTRGLIDLSAFPLLIESLESCHAQVQAMAATTIAPDEGGHQGS